MSRDPLQPWFERWRLEPDGEAFDGGTGRLAPVRVAGRPAMLKIFGSPDEARGGRVLAWWAGEGAAEVLEHDDGAVLMARASDSSPGPAEMATAGRDDEATSVLCTVVEALHRPRGTPPPLGLPPLSHLFTKLIDRPQADARLARAAAAARALLTEPRDAVVLHGDMHHFNVLDFGGGDWRAIDPWGYVGERAYDYANIARNPDLALATAPGRLERQLTVIAGRAGLDFDRLRAWTFAHAGLAAVWELEDGHDPSRSYAVLDALA